MRIRLLAALFGIGLASAAGAQAPAGKAPEATAPPASTQPAATSPAKAAPAIAPGTGANPPAPAPIEAPSAAEPPATAPETHAAGPAKPGDATAGAAKAAACAACHGMDGNSADPQYPKIAGQHERYIARQLDLFKTGERANAVMLGFATALSAQDMRDIGAYFASTKVIAGVADDGRVKADAPQTWAERGQRLYRGGNRETGLPACMACHGPTGRGNPGPAYPELAGQHAGYTTDLLKRFRSGTAFGTGERASTIMAQVAASLSDEDITALASYIEGLHRAGATPAAQPAAPAPAPAAAAAH